MIGKTLTHYQILEKIGAGGMGEVYRALDTKLDREVALKVLPADLARDPQRLVRFEREAKVVASLKHPHIVTIYSVEEADGLRFITMELVEGDTLSKHLPGDGLPLDRVFEIAIPLADAVSSAHAQGITHRDLKPDNIMFDKEGRLRVLDFGLAKLQDATGPEDKTLALGASPATEEGKILGTVAYMSPEQAEGKAVDARSDIFSLGTILYEMVTGTRPFRGDTGISTLGSILKDEPVSVTELKPASPRHLGRIIRRCLAKDPGRRYPTATDLRNDLEDFKTEIESGEIRLVEPATGSRGGRGPRRRLVLGMVTLAVVAVGLGYGLFGLLPRGDDVPASPPPRGHMEMTRLTHSGNAGYSATISPDGKYVVHIAYGESGEDGSALWLLQVSTGRSVQIIPPSVTSYGRPTFSPDGEFIYYVVYASDGDVQTLYRIPVLGGPSVRVLDDVEGRVSFSPDGSRIVFRRTHDAQKDELVVADLDGGNEQVIASRTSPEEYHRSPVWSPDGTVVAVTGTRFGHEEFHVVEVPFTGGAERRISSTPWNHIEELAWLPDGSGLVMQAVETGGAGSFQIWELSYADGTARRITNDLNSYSGVTLTADGESLVTQLMESSDSLWLTGTGEAAEPERITPEVASYTLTGVSWTPDGRIVYGATSREGIDLWITAEDGGRPRQLTSGGKSDDPSVSPDGRYVVYRSTASEDLHIWRMDMDGGNAAQLTFGDGERGPQCHPDGRSVLFLGDIRDGYALYRISIDGGDPVQISEKVLSWRPPAISPDGLMVAVDSYDEIKGKWQTEILQIAGGESIRTMDLTGRAFRWSPDGNALDYALYKSRAGNIWSHPLNGDPPRQLTHFGSEGLTYFAWAPDGESIAVIRSSYSWDVVLLENFR